MDSDPWLTRPDASVSWLVGHSLLVGLQMRLMVFLSNEPGPIGTALAED